jgi:hypothetical protein
MADINLIAQALQGIQRPYEQIQGGEQGAMQAMADFIRNNNLNYGDVAKAASTFAYDPWDEARVAAAMQQYGPMQAGLNPAMNTLQAAGQDATGRIGQTQGRVSDLFTQGYGRISPFVQPGIDAGNLQAALSGAMGRDSQATAFQNYMQSPEMAFMQGEAERALTRNAAALGGLGGANVRRDLTQLATGFASQDYANNFARLGEVANRGYGAATTGSGLSAQEAGQQSNLGQFSANIPMQTGSQMANQQFQTGRDISQNIGATTTGLAGLMERQGAGAADIVGGNANQVANLYRLATEGNAQAIEELGRLMQNTNMVAAGQVAGAPTTPAMGSNYGSQVSQIIGGTAGLLAGMPNNAPNTMGPNTANNTVPGYGPSYVGAYNPQPSPGSYLAGF